MSKVSARAQPAIYHNKKPSRELVRCLVGEHQRDV
jgi:hypothetical protein